MYVLLRAMTAPSSRLIAREALAEFIRDAAVSFKEAYWLPVRGDNDFSLCVHTLLSIDDYAELLYHAELLCSGRRGYESTEESWRRFLQEYNINGRGDSGYAEVTEHKGYTHKLKTPGSTTDFTSRRKLLFVRIGKYNEDGESTSPSSQFNCDVRPPRFNAKLRSAGRKLKLAIKPIIGTIDIETSAAIVSWIDVPALREYDDNDSDADDTDNNNNTTTTVDNTTTTTNATEVAQSTGTNVTISTTTPTPASTDNAVPVPPPANLPTYNAKYPLLSSLNIDLMDRSESAKGLQSKMQMSNLLREIVEYQSNYDGEVGYEANNSKYQYKLLRIPMSDNEQQFYQKAKQHNWVNDLLSNVIRGGKVRDGFRCFVEYMMRRHKDDAQQVFDELGVSPSIMTEHEVAATLHKGGIGIGAWRRVKQCLQTFMGLKTVSVPENRLRELGNDHGEVTTGEFLYEKAKGERIEKIRYWTLDPAVELVNKVERMVNGIDDFDPENIEYTHSAYSGDHGCQKFRMASKLFMKYMDEDKTDIYALADVSCKKDNGVVLKNTIMEAMTAGVNKVEDSALKFTYHEGSKMKWKVELVKKEELELGSNGVKPVTAFLSGDLAFLFLILGRENFSGHWCYICMLQKKDWQSFGHSCGGAWTLETMTEQLQLNEHAKKKGAERKGVVEPAYFNIPIERVVFPLLHALIGVGNQLLQYIVDYGEQEIQCLERAEISLLQQQRDNENELEVVSEMKTHFEEHDKAHLNGLVRRRGRLEAWLGENEQHPDAASQRDSLREVIDEIHPMQEAIDSIDSTMKSLKAKIKASKKRLEQYRLDRKRQEQSIVSGIDAILKDHRVQRAAYHGGDLQGTGVIKMMEHAVSISTEVGELFVNNKDSRRCEQSDEEIRDKCRKWGDALTTWDEIFRVCQTRDPAEDDFERAEVLVKIGMKQIRELQLSITPKLHGVEAHIVAQMRAIPGGIAQLMEYWMEHYHQTGSNFDSKHRHTKDQKSLAEARLSIESRSSHPQTQRDIQRVENQFTTGKRKSTLAKEAAETRAKKERVEKLIAKSGCQR